MPTYEYECGNCGRFEREQRITDAPHQRCDSCHGKVHRLISGGSFYLKGSGGEPQQSCQSESGGCEGCPCRADAAASA